MPDPKEETDGVRVGLAIHEVPPVSGKMTTVFNSTWLLGESVVLFLASNYQTLEEYKFLLEHVQSKSANIFNTRCMPVIIFFFFFNLA